MRRRGGALKIVKELDAFTKVPEDYQRTTASGGTFSIISISAILILVFSEFLYYRSTVMKYEYSVDVDMLSSLELEVDMTIAMSCQYLGADIVDLAGESVPSNFLTMADTTFELSNEQKQWFETRNAVLSSIKDYRSLNDLVMLESITSTPFPQTDMSDGSTDSCRLVGKTSLKKVAGNFHITAGKSITHARGHSHLNAFIPLDAYNFSHRIDKFAFGASVPGSINPLDGTLYVTDERARIFQYFMQVVPTEYETLSRHQKTHQYSVTDRIRTLDHSKGSHGVPGIFFKYDLSAVSVKIVEERRPFWQFLVRLCGIVGGVFATSGMIHLLVGAVFDLFGKKNQTTQDTSNSQ
ncbi:endoplasmic reticulum-Golgi intermediate compartment protein 2-like [Dysidea avara]|uniref:endoplasmic reticulum-Golgi intermediate compartment protein 2-like n=1 Tax=Dysidea avara TaxID=196820 RepID=UPI003319C24A